MPTPTRTTRTAYSEVARSTLAGRVSTRAQKSCSTTRTVIRTSRSATPNRKLTSTITPPTSSSTGVGLREQGHERHPSLDPPHATPTPSIQMRGREGALAEPQTARTVASAARCASARGTAATTSCPAPASNPPLHQSSTRAVSLCARTYSCTHGDVSGRNSNISCVWRLLGRRVFGGTL